MPLLNKRVLDGFGPRLLKKRHYNALTMQQGVAIFYETRLSAPGEITLLILLPHMSILNWFVFGDRIMLYNHKTIFYYLKRF